MSESKPLEKEKFITTNFRFIELGLFMLVGIMTQFIWISFAPISHISATYYGVGRTSIMMLATVFMIAYIPVNFVASWCIDKFGLKWGVGIGVIITGIFGFSRYLAGTNFGLVMTFQIMCAIGQPFVLNSFSKMAALWFPEKEKATASGLGTISLLIGSILGMMIPELIENLKIDKLLLWYGIISLVFMVLYLVFAKEKPEHIPNKYADKSKALVTKGTMDLFKIKDFNLLLFMLFIGLGVFNAITTKIDFIFPEDWDSGLIGGFMIIGGVFGAIILSAISDAKHKRKIFLIIAMITAVPLSILIGVINVEIIVYIVSGIFGFLLVSAMPIGITYAAEITYPATEELSAGLMMVLGQVGGLLFLLIPDSIFMYVVAGLFAITAVTSFLIKDTEYHEKLREEKGIQ